MSNAVNEDKQCELSSTEKGKHAELLAATALLANGYAVLEPIAPEPYDLAVRRKDDKETFYVQVKTAFVRDEKRYGGEYLVVKGAKNNGDVYTDNEVDFLSQYGAVNATCFPTERYRSIGYVLEMWALSGRN